MNKMLFLLPALLLIGLLAGCARETSSGSTTGGREYFPNTDGYSWTYRATLSATTETVIMRVTFSGTSTVDSLDVQKQRNENFYSSRASTAESLIRVTDTSVKIYGSTTYPTTDASTMLVFPFSVGAKWFTYGSAEMNVIAQEDVTVPTGTYSGCFRIRQVNTSSSGTSTNEMWLAKNVGLVKIMQVGTGVIAAMNYVGTIELTSKSF